MHAIANILAKHIPSRMLARLNGKYRFCDTCHDFHIRVR